MPFDSNFQIGSFEISYVGLWVFVKAKEMGVTLQWDKTTTVVARLDAMHRGKVEGSLTDFRMNGNYSDCKMNFLLFEKVFVVTLMGWRLMTSKHHRIPSKLTK